MRSLVSALFVLALVGLLSACGLRGPLYLPDEEGSEQPSSQQSAEEKEKKEREDEDII